jgi:catechol 2,3-dioxygenase-like lactoylglutathione lyase family enzyme
VTIQGVGHLYIETHDWDKSVAFWKQLGFELEFETDHHSGSLVAPNGSRIFVAEQSPEDPLAIDIYFDASDAASFRPESPVEVVRGFTATHWGTQVMTVRDPDGRSFRIEAPGAPEPTD